MKKFQLVIWMICLVMYAQGRATEWKIDRKNLKSDVRILSADSMEGRGLGTRGHDRAASFIAGKFGDLGLAPFDTGLHPDYNKPTDTWRKINFRTLQNRVRQVALVLELMQQEGWEN